MVEKQKDIASKFARPFASSRNWKREGGVAIYATLELEGKLLHTDENIESTSVKSNDFRKYSFLFLF